MGVFSYDDPDFFEAITPEFLRLHRQIAREAGADIDAVTVMSNNAADVEAPAVALLNLPPGYVLERHAHGCYRVEIIIRGWVEAEGKTLYPGSIMTALPGENYGPMTAGPEGVLSAEIFSSRRGMQPIRADEVSEQLAKVIDQIRAAY
jgi:hypothetical protein